MEPVIEITRSQLVAALEQWEFDSKDQKWPARDDAQRHGDNADYLIGLMKQ